MGISHYLSNLEKLRGCLRSDVPRYVWFGAAYHFGWRPSKISRHSLAIGSHCLTHSGWSAVLGCSVYSLCHYELLWYPTLCCCLNGVSCMCSLYFSTVYGFDTLMEVMSHFRFSYHVCCLVKQLEENILSVGLNQIKCSFCFSYFRPTQIYFIVSTLFIRVTVLL